MMLTFRWIAALALMASCGGGEGEDGDQLAARSPCEQIRDHLVELRLAASHGLSPDQLAQHRTALEQAMGPSFLETCAANVNERQAACVAAAIDSHAASICLTSSGESK